MNPTFVEGTSETAPLRNGARPAPFLAMKDAGQTFGTPYFLISTLLASIIPIIKLGIGLYYKDQCPIDQRIPTYMIVAGIAGLAMAALAVLLAVTFMCFVSDSTALNVMASCGVCGNLLATLAISVFMFIWFILGCVWVFGVRSQVQFNDPLKLNYCHPVLYKWSFALLVITLVWALLQCCLSCFRQCCTGRSS